MGSVSKNSWTFIVFVLICIALAGCSTTKAPPASDGKANFCDVATAWVGPKAEAVIVANAPYTTAFLLQHNLYGEQTCGWKPPVKKTR